MTTSRARVAAAPSPPSPALRKGLSPLVISLPHGLDLGGVTSWAVRLANGLAQRGRGVALLVHPRNPGQPEAEFDLHPRVMRIEPDTFPPMHNAGGDLSPYLPVYREAIRGLAEAMEAPVVFSPNILGDSYGLGAALCAVEPENIRLLGWQHTDSEYDTWLLQRYEPIISRYIAIDPRYAKSLAARMPHRTPDILSIPHGVAVPASAPSPRTEMNGRPIRLVYTGRLDHKQKRILALAHLSDELTARSIDHEIVVMGDGPAGADLEQLCRSRPKIVRIRAAGPREVEHVLRRCDAFVLPSRFEGLCISRIEAMAHGCVPIITHANSGASFGLENGVSAVFVDASPDDDEKATAASLADGVARFIESNRHAMAHASWQAARETFSLERHIDAVEQVIDDAGASPARWWRASWPTAFSFSTASPGCTGSVPSHGPERLRAKLDELAGKTIVLHGAGRHTIELAGILADSRATIAAVCDDDKGRWGKPFLGWTIIDPATAKTTGATDVVLSSWMHVESVWKRRGVYEEQGLTVHRLYPER